VFGGLAGSRWERRPRRCNSKGSDWDGIFRLLHEVMSKIAAVLGKPQDAERFDTLSNEVEQPFSRITSIQMEPFFGTPRPHRFSRSSSICSLSRCMRTQRVIW